jgi:hypothetical protein
MTDQAVVLVGEGEQLVRLVIAEALRDEGFKVMEAEHSDPHRTSAHPVAL